MSEINIHDEEMKRLINALKNLQGKTAGKVFRSALTNGAKPIRKKIRARAKSMIGGNLGNLISRSIHATTASGKGGGMRGKGIYRKLVNIDNKYGNRTFAKESTDWFSQGKDIYFKPTKKGKTWIKLRQFVYIAKNGHRTYIPSAIEFGHRIANQYVRYYRRTKPIPFMRKGFESGTPAATDAVRGTLKTGVWNLARQGANTP